ncbi:hypothetical protein [Paenibacillus amylolyticus]|uniref:hypothetical protein n=1 Tax=Paenibacillus amylolyticus TaxID=1451 RepID=UPI00201D9C98|nr:hypothetical protein [Paenibacillus amylolyticus]MCL6663498.1 hypothetical protein [Paenibacillus amylolyticus]
MLDLKEKMLQISSPDVKQHIEGIMDASPTSQFDFHVTTEFPNVYVYLIEDNSLEDYSSFHVFSYDYVGQDYSFHCFPVKQMHRMHEFILKTNLD